MPKDLEDLLQAVRTDGSPEGRACGHSHLLDERDSWQRQEDYERLRQESHMGAPISDFAAGDSWHRIRDRFGLAHLVPEPDRPIPAVPMRYPVHESLRATRDKTQIEHPIRVPTVPDHRFTACFLPVPCPLPYGCTWPLIRDPECEYKVPELLHLKFPYRPEHTHKVGAITKPVTALVDPGLDALCEPPPSAYDMPVIETISAACRMTGAPHE